MTEGEWRGGVSFNPSGNGDVTAVKALAADLIDTLLALSRGVEDTLTSESDEVDYHLAWEQDDLLDRAARLVEEAAMWAVKAATKQDRPVERLERGPAEERDPPYEAPQHNDSLGG